MGPSFKDSNVKLALRQMGVKGNGDTFESRPFGTIKKVVICKR